MVATLVSNVPYSWPRESRGAGWGVCRVDDLNATSDGVAYDTLPSTRRWQPVPVVAMV